MDFHIGRQSFNIPCRRFSIRLTVSSKERLPLVKEFVLRYLYVCGSCDVENLRHFFGFSERELGILLSDLRVEGLADLFGEEVALSERGRSVFNESAGGIPQIQTVERWNERVAIDFLSFSIIHFQTRSEGFRCFHELESTDVEKVSRSREVAKEVFAESFHEYVERYKADIGNEERARLSIYGISSVESGERFAFPLSVDLYVSSEAPKQVDQRYAIFNNDAAQEKRSRIVHAVSSKILDLKKKSKFGKDIQWLLQDQFKVSFYSQFIREGRLDVGRALEGAHHFQSSSGGEVRTRPIVGAFHVVENANMVWDFMRQAKGDFGIDHENCPGRLSSSIFWQKPSTGLWGRDEETFSMISRIRREATGMLAGNSEVSLIFNERYEDAKDLKWRLTRKNNRNVFDYGFGTTFRDELCPVEAFLWPGVLGGVLYYYLEDDAAEYPIPLGFLTREPDVLNSLSGFLFRQWSGSGKKIKQYWPVMSGSGAEREVSGRKVFSALVTNHTAQNWKGKTLTLPRPRKSDKGEQ